MDGVVKEEDEDDEDMKKVMSSKNRIDDLPDYYKTEVAKNKTIVNFLKHLRVGGKINNPLQQLVVQGDKQMVVHSGPRKREGKPSDNPPVGVVLISDTPLEIVNKNGVVVDFKELLENGDELYEGEFRRRCVGLENEEAFYGFWGVYKGSGGSRRRRIISACEFGGWLPIGWKLLLGLKRKEGRVSVYCRRYIKSSSVCIVCICCSHLCTLLYTMLSKSYN